MSNLNDTLGAFAELDTAAGKVGWFNLARLEEQGVTGQTPPFPIDSA